MAWDKADISVSRGRHHDNSELCGPSDEGLTRSDFGQNQITGYIGRLDPGGPMTAQEVSPLPHEV